MKNVKERFSIIVGLFLAGMVAAGTPPTIASFAASPSSIVAGKAVSLNWTVSGATSLSINQGVGTITGKSTASVKPSATTTYTLTAANSYGSKTATATVTVGTVPAIARFYAAPSTLPPGGSSMLTWSVSNATKLTINQNVGDVTGKNSVSVKPAGTIKYTLTATNALGTSTATASITFPIVSTGGFTASPFNVAAGSSCYLKWHIKNATSIRIDPGVGDVTGDSVAVVKPTKTTTYTLAATNSIDQLNGKLTVNVAPLKQINSQVYYTEHCMFYIPSSTAVTWTGSNSWGSVYSDANVKNYISVLKTNFPGDYAFVVLAANNLLPNKVPDVIACRYQASGIGQSTLLSTSSTSYCRYNIGGGCATDGSFGVLDHEIGHNWGVFVGLEVGGPHWLANSTFGGQMADFNIDPADPTYDRLISGDPVHGFTWTRVTNNWLNQTEVFSDQDLYLQGFGASFPDGYVLDTPLVYNTDHTVSYKSATKYDQAWVEKKDGVRSPTYKASPKRLRIGLVYIARNFNEITEVFPQIERSMNFFTNSEAIDTTTYDFEVPFLVETHYRASVNALLADMDGNHTPTLSITSPTYMTSSNGGATVNFSAGDADKTTPTISVIGPEAAKCMVGGNTITISGLANGSHFFTVKAQDAGGKKTFAHFVIDVQGAGLGKRVAAAQQPEAAPSRAPSMSYNRAHTQVAFTIDKLGWTTLTLYRANGGRIATLVEKMLEPGSYAYALPRDWLGSGMVVAVLKSESGRVVLPLSQMKGGL